MKRSTILAGVLVLSLAPLAMATPAVMKKANDAKNGTTYVCTTCHSGKPCTAANLTEEGKKWNTKK